MSERFVRYFWEAITFTSEKFQSDADTCEYIYFYDLKDSIDAKDVIFPFLLSSENANARRVCDVVKIYFPDYGEIDDVVRIVNHGYLSLYGFQSSGEKTLILSAPLFAMPYMPTFTGAGTPLQEEHRRPYSDVEMEPIYDYFTVVVTFPEGRLILTSQVTMTIFTEGITERELVFKSVITE